MSPVLAVDRVRAVLRQVVEADGCPHTASLVSSSTSSVIASSFVEPRSPPFPPPKLDARSKVESEREAMYAAVALSGWQESKEDDAGGDGDDDGMLLLDTDLGRVAVAEITASFMLVLTAIDVAPWPVLDKKARLLIDALRDPLSKLD